MAIYNRKLSSKCCLEDTIDMYTDFEESKITEFLAKTDIYQGVGEDFKPVDKIDILSYKDLVPYLPFCESIMCMDKNGRNMIILQKKPHWLYEEKERIDWIVKEVTKIYNRCKRKKVPFKIEEHLNEIIFSNDYQDVIFLVADRIVNLGKKATFTDIYLNFTNKFYREPLVDEMIKSGYTKEQAVSWAYNNKKTW